MGKIITRHVYPPIPDRSFDWCAYHDGEEEKNYHQGWGRTEAEAISDLERLDQERFEIEQDNEQLRYETETEIWNANDSEDLGGAIMWRKLEP